MKLTPRQIELANAWHQSNAAADNLRTANASKDAHKRRQALVQYNRARADYSRLRKAFEAGTEPAKPLRHYGVDFETTVNGIPVGVAILSFEPGRDNMRGHIDNWLPDDPEEIEWVLVDRKGYRAEWLEAKMTREDAREVESVALDAMRNARDEL